MSTLNKVRTIVALLRTLLGGHEPPSRVFWPPLQEQACTENENRSAKVAMSSFHDNEGLRSHDFGPHEVWYSVLIPSKTQHMK